MNFNENRRNERKIAEKSRGCTFKIGLKTLLQQGISEPIFYVDLVYNSNELFENLILVINSKR